MHRVVDCSSDCAQNAFEILPRINVVFVLDLEGSNHCTFSTMAFACGSQHSRSSDEFLLETALGFELRGCFRRKFSSTIHDDLCRPWMSSKPCEFKTVRDTIGSFGRDLSNLNQLVAGSIIVRHHNWIDLSFLGFLSSCPKVHGPIRSIHNVCQGTTSGLLGGRIPYFLDFFLASRQSVQALVTRVTMGFNPFQS